MTPDQIKHLWRLLAQTYGQRWAEQYGPTPNEAWSAYLATIDAQRAKHGLHKAIHSGCPHPPSLPEFIAYVKTFREASVIQFNGPRLEHQQPMTRELIREGLDRLRRELNLPPRKSEPTKL